MTILKACELCSEYLDCKLYDKVCENLVFLKNFIEINDSTEIAKYCKKYNTKKRK